MGRADKGEGAQRGLWGEDGLEETLLPCDTLISSCTR